MSFFSVENIFLLGGSQSLAGGGKANEVKILISKAGVIAAYFSKTTLSVSAPSLVSVAVNTSIIAGGPQI